MNDARSAVTGLDPATLGRTAGVLQGVIDSGDLSGGVTLVWRKGGIAQVQALGRRDIGKDLPMQRDTLFRIASMTKPVTSAAAMMLADEGKLALSDPITRWAPEFSAMRVLASPTGPLEDTYPSPREITIEDLLTHRAGLAYGFSSTGPIAKAHEAALGDTLNRGGGPDPWMRALGALPLSYPPGERFHYSHATDVLGFIVGRIAGMTFRDFLIERIFGPLGMVDTDFYAPASKRDRLAVVYRLDEASDALAPVAFRQYDAPPAFCGGGAGLISTADDFLAFARMLLAGGELDGVRLLRPETVAMMRENRLTEAQRKIPFFGMPFWEGQGFGLGLSVVTDPEKQAWMGAGSKGAFGWPGAFGTWWQADPAQDMVILYLIQNSFPLAPEAIAQYAASRGLRTRIALPMFQKLVYEAISD